MTRFFPRLKPESPDLLHLDMLRLLASCAIVVVHFRSNLLAFSSTPRPIFAMLGGLSVCVDLFFVISGFVISWVYRDSLRSKAGYRTFLIKRIARLGPLHWATLLFFVVVGLLAAVTGVQLARAVKYDWACVLPNALLLHAWNICSGPSFNTVSWSISAEVTMYALYPLLFIAVSRRPLMFAVAVTVLLIALETSSVSPFWIERTFEFGVIRALPAFCIGILAFRYRNTLGRIAGARYWLIVAIILFLVAMATGLPKAVLVLVAYAIGALGVAADMRGAVSGLVRRLAPGGRLTYSIYMLHPIVQSLFIMLIGRKVLHLSGWAISLWTLLAFLVTGAFAYLSLIWFEEPARRWLVRHWAPQGAASKGDKFSL